jgi:hypothetical protein
MPPIMESRLGVMRLGYSPLGYPLVLPAHSSRLNKFVLGYDRLGVPDLRPELTVSVTALTFPPNFGASQTLPVTLTNTGAAPLTVTSLTLGFGLFFSLATSCGGTIAAGASCTIDVTFFPVLSVPSAGTYTDTLTITVPWPARSATVALSGTTMLPLVYSPTALTFGPQRVGVTTALTVMLTNIGPDLLAVPTWGLRGTDAARWAILSTTCGATIAPGASCAVVLAFTPVGLGTFTAVLADVMIPLSPVTLVPLTGLAIPDAGVPLPLRIEINGVDRTTQVRVEGVSIDQQLNGVPDALTCRVAGATPLNGQDVKLYLNGTTAADLEFAGRIQERTAIHEGPATRVAFDLNAVDYTWLLNRRKVTRYYAAQSASAILADLISRFTNGFTAANIVGGLPTVGPFTFTDADVTDCFDQVTGAMGGYWYADYSRDLHAFLDEAAAADSITDATPHGMITIRESVDLSQVRTRIYVTGAGSTASSDVASGSSTLPVTDGEPFNSGTFGTVTTPTQRLSYLGVMHVAKLGSITRGQPGTAPTGGAPSATLANNYDGGLRVGNYSYKFTYVSPLGETQGSVAFFGTVTPFLFGASGSSLAPAQTSPIVAGGLTHGSYSYQVTYENPNGETGYPNGASSNGTISQVPNASTAPTLTGMIFAPGTSYMTAGTYKYGVSFVDAGGETLVTTVSQITISGTTNGVALSAIPVSTDPRVTSRRIYRSTAAGGTTYYYIQEIGDNTTTTYTDGLNDAYLTFPSPSANSSGTGQMALTSISLGPAGTTARHIYRTPVGVTTSALSLKKVATISDNTTTVYTDSQADTALGESIPATNTADGGQLVLTGIPAGPAGTTARKLYRTEVGGSVFKALTTLSNNTTTTFADNVEDSSLGEPIGPGSIVAQPGDTEIAVASSAVFAPSGWARVGSQVVRYASSVLDRLSGIPASGPGSLTTVVSVGSEVAGEPFLTNVTGWAFDIPSGESVTVFVERNDPTAQTAMAALVGGDGIVEDTVNAGDVTLAECVARGDAELALRKDPIATLHVTTRNRSVQVGRLQSVNLTQPPIVGTYRIQHVTITEFGQPNQRWPLRTVDASSRQFSLADLLRTLRKAS